MESPTLLSPKPNHDYRSSVDTSRPFRSVKEAVAIFGERILVREIYSPKPYYTPPRLPSHENYHTSWTNFPSPAPSALNFDKDYDNNNNEFLDSLKKLKAELEQTKAELKSLKERESETEIAVASLNAELHKNMSKLAEAEAAAAAKKASAATRRVSFDKEKKEDVIKEEEKKREFMIRMENPRNLAQILSLGEEKGYFGGGKKERKVMKKKPIVPLVRDFFFFRKKGSSNKTLNNPLYASSQGVF